MNKIYFDVTDHKLVKTIQNEYVAGYSQGYDICSFTFDEEWQALNKTAVFKQAEGGTAYAAVIADDAAIIPAQVLTADTNIYVGLYGSNEDSSVVLTTNWERIILVAGVAEADMPAPPEQSVYDSIYNMAVDAKAIALRVKEDADGGIFNGEKGDPGEGLITGGIENQALVKNSGTDYDMKWLDVQEKNKVNTIIVNTPVWTNQPEIAGELNNNFTIWNDDYYFITLRESVKVKTATGVIFYTTTKQIRINETSATFAIGDVITITGVSFPLNNVEKTIITLTNNGNYTTYTCDTHFATAGTSTTPVTVATSTPLPENTFKLCSVYNGFATATDQTFILLNLSTGNSGVLYENTVVDFKEIGDNWVLRDAGVLEIDILTNPQKGHRYNINAHYDFVQVAPGNVTTKYIGAIICQDGIDVNSAYYILNIGSSVLNTTDGENVLFQPNISMQTNDDAYKYFSMDFKAEMVFSNKFIQTFGSAAGYAAFKSTALSVFNGIGCLYKTNGDIPDVNKIFVSCLQYYNPGRMFRNGTQITVEEVIL